MKTNFIKGVSFQLKPGAHVLLEQLAGISKHLNALLQALIKYDLIADDLLAHLQVALVHLDAPHAVLEFKLLPAPLPEHTVFKAPFEQLSQQFDKLLALAHEGNYFELRALYQHPESVNAMVQAMYGFINSFGTQGALVVQQDPAHGYQTLYALKPFSPGAKNSAMMPHHVAFDAGNYDLAVATVAVAKFDKAQPIAIQELFQLDDQAVAYAPQTIAVNNKVYHLQFPLRCALQKHHGYYLIESELLGIVGTGTSLDEARNSFAQEFDFIYQRYNSLEANQLSARLNSIKHILNFMVNSVE